MRMTHKTKDGLTNYYCEKCELVIGALGGSTCWCRNGHRMMTKQDIDERDARKKAREEQKNG